MPDRQPPKTSSLLLVISLLCCAGYFVRLDSFPPYLDFDSATEGIFINNLTFRGSHEFFFRDSQTPQDQYRLAYAAYRLPLSIPLSWIQKLLSFGPADVDLLCKIVGAVGFIIGSVFAAMSLGLTANGFWFLVGATAVFPPILLAARTGIMFWGVLFAAYWGVILCITRYADTLRNRYLYLSSPLAAYLALNLWANLPTLPIAALLLLLWKRRLRAALLNPHTWLALLLTIGIIAAVYFGIATSLGMTFDEYWTRAKGYPFERQGTVSLSHLGIDELRPKLTKLLNQQFLFTRDTLGDPFRPDFPWTLGALHIPWLLLLPLLLSGALLAVRNRQHLAPHLAVLFAVYLFFLTLSFPEGRYMLLVAPCYMALIDLSLTRVSRSEREQNGLRICAMLLLGCGTFLAIAGPYNAELTKRWQNMDGMREIARALTAQPPDSPAFISLPQQFWYGDWLYFSMLTNFTPRWVSAEEFEQRKKESAALFLVQAEDDTGSVPAGATQIGEARSAQSGKRFRIYRLLSVDRTNLREPITTEATPLATLSRPRD